MQSSCHKSSDGSGAIDGISGNPRFPPRIGDNYQVNVSPFKLKMDHDQLGMNNSKDSEDGKAEDVELLFVEELPVPVMHICYFSPFRNGTSSDNGFHAKESFPIAAIEKDCGLCQLDLSEMENEQCTNEISNSGQLREDNAVCSITDLKTQFLRPKDTTTESTVTAENVLDTSSYFNGHRRKRGKDSNCQVQQQGTHNTGEDASSRIYMIVPGRKSASWSKSEEDLFILGLHTFGKNLELVHKIVGTKEMGDILSYYYGKFFKTESFCRWAESRRTTRRKSIFSGRRKQELLKLFNETPSIPRLLKRKIRKVITDFDGRENPTYKFVADLKALAGPNQLIQVGGIGKGKDDLTAASIETVKTNQVSSSCQEILTGGACSNHSRIRKTVTLPPDDGSDRSQNVSWGTEDKNKLGLVPSQQCEHCTHYAEGNSLNCNSEESTRVVVDHESSSQRNEFFGTCNVSTPDQWDCLPSPLKQRKLTTCISNKEDTKAANLIESSASKDQTKMLKINPMEEFPEPQSLLGAIPLEINMRLPYLTQANAGRSINTTFVSTYGLSANKINNNSQYSRICSSIPEIGPGLNIPQDEPIKTVINSLPVMSSQISEASISEKTYFSEAYSGHPQEVLNNSGAVQSSRPGPDESHSTKLQENDGSTLQKKVRRHSTRNRHLTPRALEAFASGFLSPKRGRKGS